MYRSPDYTPVLINVSAVSVARPRGGVKAAGERASDTAVWTWPPVIAVDAGRYGNSMVWKSGVEVCGDRNSESQTRHHALRSWILLKSTEKSVVEEAARRDLFGGRA